MPAACLPPLGCLPPACLPTPPCHPPPRRSSTCSCRCRCPAPTRCRAASITARGQWGGCGKSREPGRQGAEGAGPLQHRPPVHATRPPLCALPPLPPGSLQPAAQPQVLAAGALPLPGTRRPRQPAGLLLSIRGGGGGGASAGARRSLDPPPAACPPSQPTAVAPVPGVCRLHRGHVPHLLRRAPAERAVDEAALRPRPAPLPAPRLRSAGPLVRLLHLADGVRGEVRRSLR